MNLIRVEIYFTVEVEKKATSRKDWPPPFAQDLLAQIKTLSRVRIKKGLYDAEERKLKPSLCFVLQLVRIQGSSIFRLHHNVEVF